MKLFVIRFYYINESADSIKCTWNSVRTNFLEIDYSNQLLTLFECGYDVGFGEDGIISNLI